MLAIQAGKPEVVKDFFTQHAEPLLQQAEASDWLVWFALPYISNPAQDERFQVSACNSQACNPATVLHLHSCYSIQLTLLQVYFTKDWMALVETSFRNLISQGIQHLPLPGLLHFNTDRLERQALRKQLEELQTSSQLLKQQLSGSTANPSAAPSDRSKPSTHEQHQVPLSADKLQPQNQPAVAQQLRKAQGNVPAQSTLLQVKTKTSEASSASISPPKPISTAVKNHDAQAPAMAGSVQWEAGNNVQAQDTLLQSQAASSEPDTAAAAASHASSSQGSATASMTGAKQGSNVSTTPRMNGNGVQSSQDGALQPNSTQVSASDTAALTVNSTAELPAAAHSTTGQLGQAPARQTSFDVLPASAQQDPATTATGALPAIESAEANYDSAADPGAADGAALKELVTRGEELLGHHHAITCCSFSPNGQNLATASSDGVVRIWAPESLQVALLACRPALSAHLACQ